MWLRRFSFLSEESDFLLSGVASGHKSSQVERRRKQARVRYGFNDREIGWTDSDRGAPGGLAQWGGVCKQEMEAQDEEECEAPDRGVGAASG